MGKDKFQRGGWIYYSFPNFTLNNFVILTMTNNWAEKIAIAIDVPDFDSARKLMDQLDDSARLFKVVLIKQAIALLMIVCMKRLNP